MDLVSLAPGARPGAFRNDGASPPDRIVVNARDYVAHHEQLRARFAALRGTELGANRGVVPATNVGDVLKLARAWSEALTKANLSADDSAEIRRWTRALARVVELARGRQASEVYPENPQFWQQDTRRLAILLESLKVRPSRWSIGVESVGEALDELPDRLEEAGRKAGEIAAAPVKGAAEGLGISSTALLAVGAGIAGLLLLPRVLR